MAIFYVTGEDVTFINGISNNAALAALAALLSDARKMLAELAESLACSATRR